MRVALTGVSGFLGSTIARHLHQAGHQVTGLVRATSRRDHVEPVVDRFVVGDQDDVSAWPALTDGADCVIHNSVNWVALKSGDFEQHLASNLDATLRLIRESAARQFIFISTIAVHHDMRSRWGGKIDEDHPTRPSTLYGAFKASVEAHLWAAHFADGQHFCSMRPCAIYGIDPNLQRSIGHPIIKTLQRKRRFTKPGGGKFVHVDDVAAVTAAAVGNANAHGVYNLADCYARWADLATMAAEIMGLDAEIDLSSPAQPKNTFTKDAAQSLGVSMDRGHDGLREHLRELIEHMNASH